MTIVNEIVERSHTIDTVLIYFESANETNIPLCFFLSRQAFFNILFTRIWSALVENNSCQLYCSMHHVVFTFQQKYYQREFI